VRTEVRPDAGAEIEAEIAHQLVDRRVAEIPCDGQALVLGHHDVAGVDQFAQDAAVGLRAAGNTVFQHLAVRPCVVPGGAPDRPQHRYGHGQPFAGAGRGAPAGIAVETPVGDRRGELRTEQDHAPGQVDPQEEDRDRRHGAVDDPVRIGQAQVEAETVLQDLEQDRGDGAAGDAVPKPDPPVRNDPEQQREDDHFHDEGDQRRHPVDETPEDADDLVVGLLLEPVAERHAGPHEDRRQGQDRPERQEARAPGSRLHDAPDRVERRLDRPEQDESRHGETEDADGRQFTGVAEKDRDLLARRGTGLGHERRQQELLRLVPYLVEGREGAEHCQEDREDRDQTEQRGVGQGRRNHQAVVVVEAPQHVPDERDGVAHRLGPLMPSSQKSPFP
jgi:hypothetical protein